MTNLNVIKRCHGRAGNELRPVSFRTDINKQAEGAVLIETGDTCVLCTASVEEKTPSFLNGTQKGWITAEYGMLPRSTSVRTPRESTKGKPSGRTMEIQRLIGRSLRAVVDTERLGPRTLWLDCDVLQADGGTRTASITGAFVAMAMALHQLQTRGVISRLPITTLVAATSVGMINGQIFLDLDYKEDSSADVDMNVVMIRSGDLVEIQGTGERCTFSKERMLEMLEQARLGIASLHQMQADILQKHGITIPV